MAVLLLPLSLSRSEVAAAHGSMFSLCTYLPQSHPSSLSHASLSHPHPTAANQHKMCPLLFPYQSNPTFIGGDCATCVTGYQVIPLTGVTDSCLTPTDITNPRFSHSTLLISPFTDSSRSVARCCLASHISHMSRVEPVQGCCPSCCLLPNTLTDSSRKVKIVTFHPPLTLSVIYSPNLFLHLKPQVKQTYLDI